MSAELQGGIELPGYAGVDSNEPSRHDGTPAMSNQCQLNFPARLLSLDSRRVSLPFVCVHMLAPLVNDGPETPWIVSRVRSEIPRFCDYYSAIRYLSFVEDPLRVSSEFSIPSRRYPSISRNYVLAGPKFSTLSTFVCSKFAFSPNSLKSWHTRIHRFAF